MSIKWIGAMLIVAGCAFAGFAMAGAYCREERTLRQFVGALDYMACELQYRMTPLPELCAQAAEKSGGCIGAVFQALATELSRQIQSDVERCMNRALEEGRDIPDKTLEMFRMLGASLGRFDLDGQIKGLENVRSCCSMMLKDLSNGREARLRSYQTLGICTGAALAIIFV